MDYLVSGRIGLSNPICRPAARWSGDVLPSGSHVVVAVGTDPSLAEAVYPSVGPLGQRQRWRQRSAARCLLVGLMHGRHCCNRRFVGG